MDEATGHPAVIVRHVADVVCARVDWDRTALNMPVPGRFHTTHITPEPGYPFGRKGLVLTRVWAALGGDAAGMLTLDGDVAVDPVDHAAMMASIDTGPEMVWVAPVACGPSAPT